MAGVKIAAAASGGSAEIAGPPSSSANTVLKLPGDTGSAGQVLKVKSANHSATNAELEWAADAGGKILQVVQSTKSDTTSIDAASWADITGTDEAGGGSVWECNITPSAATSKILVHVDIKIGSNAYQQDALFQLYRTMGGTSTLVYAGDAADSRGRCFWGTEEFGYASGTSAQYYMKQVSANYLDTITGWSSGAVTYNVKWYGRSGSVLYLNRTGADSDNVNYPRTISSIIVQEVGA